MGFFFTGLGVMLGVGALTALVSCPGETVLKFIPLERDFVREIPVSGRFSLFSAGFGRSEVSMVNGNEMLGARTQIR